MIARLWRTKIDRLRIAEYKRFARETSLPMFRQQAGFIGVHFLRRGNESVVVSLWSSGAAVEALALSETYDETVKKIEAAGFLVGACVIGGFRGVWRELLGA